MARYWSTPIKRVASKVAMETRVLLAVRRQQRAGNMARLKFRTSQNSKLIGLEFATSSDPKFS